MYRGKGLPLPQIVYLLKFIAASDTASYIYICAQSIKTVHIPFITPAISIFMLLTLY